MFNLQALDRVGKGCTYSQDRGVIGHLRWSGRLILLGRLNNLKVLEKQSANLFATRHVTLCLYLHITSTENNVFVD